MLEAIKAATLLSIGGPKKQEVKGDNFVCDVEVEGNRFWDVLHFDRLATKWQVLMPSLVSSVDSSHSHCWSSHCRWRLKWLQVSECSKVLL